jgi:hypothetical protein
MTVTAGKSPTPRGPGRAHRRKQLALAQRHGIVVSLVESAYGGINGADIYHEEEVRYALDIGGHVPVQHCDARERNSSKQVLARLLEYLLTTATAGTVRDRYR